MSYGEVKYTTRSIALAFTISFLIAISLLYSPVVPDILYLVVAVVLGYALSMRLLVELGSRTAYRLKVSRHIEGSWIEGREVSIKTRIENPTMLPIVYAEISDNYPRLFHKKKGINTTSTPIPAKGFIELNYTIVPRLGLHVFDGLEVLVKDPLGLFAYKLIVPNSRQVVRVYPAPIPLPRRIIGRWVTTSLGLSKSRIRGIGQEFMMLREYVPGDDYRFIDWKAFARHNKPFVKVFEREASLYLVLVLDAAPYMFYGLLGKTPLETIVRVIAGLLKNLAYKRDWISLIVRTYPTPRIIGLGRGRRQYHRIMRELASIKWVQKEPPISLPHILRESIAKLPKRTKALFLVFTSIGKYTNGNELQELIDAVSKARALNHDVVIVSPLPELYELETISGIEASLYTILASTSIQRAQKAATTLCRRGIKVIQVGPSSLLPRLISFIETYRSVAG